MDSHMNSTDERGTASCLHNAWAEPITLTDPQVLRFPYPTYARLRKEHPVYFSEEIRHWVVTRYGEVAAVLQDAVRLPHCAAADDFRDCLDPFIERPSLPMSFMGLTGQTPLRDVLSDVMAREHVHSLRPYVQEAVRSTSPSVACAACRSCSEGDQS
jgi:cytochrome P450